MTFLHRYPLVAGVGSALIVAGLAGCGGNDGNRADSSAPAVADSAGARNMTDSVNASAALNDTSAAMLLSSTNRAEIAAGQLATTKARNSEVKAFARMMVQEHRANTTKLRSILSAARITLPDSAASSARRDTGAARGMDGSMSMSGHPLLDQLEQQNTRAMDQLRSAGAADFDRTYMDAQVTAHQQVLDILKRSGTSVNNPDIQAQLSATRTAVEQHLQRAQEISAKLSGSPSTAPRP